MKIIAFFGLLYLVFGLISFICNLVATLKAKRYYGIYKPEINWARLIVKDFILWIFV